MMIGDCRVDQFPAMCLERVQGAHLVGAHETAVPNDIGGQNGCKPALYGLALHGLSLDRHSQN
jgi:hypothetical protein